MSRLELWGSGGYTPGLSPAYPTPPHHQSVPWPEGLARRYQWASRPIASYLAPAPIFTPFTELVYGRMGGFGRIVKDADANEFTVWYYIAPTRVPRL